MLRNVFMAPLKPSYSGIVHPQSSPVLSVTVMSASPRLELARNLVRLYREVLEQPVPAELMSLLERLEAQQGALP